MIVQSSPPAAALVFQSERLQDAAEIEALYERVFGPGRFTKVSERVREIAAAAPELSFCAFAGDRLMGVVRLWRVRVGDKPIVFLGPLAVESAERRAGIGQVLVERACDAAAEAGEQVVVLVGDEAYFQRIGFSSAHTGDIRLPGPVDQRRVLARALTPGGDRDLAGVVRAA
ncbi:GNAT family N-acetyltransferase [Phenylobacterium immobile]|uniref:GNAT family N-acetyltransferase n=1 Tax=Phenylobacterium immobile TaxID=21 RepID=UPI000AD79220|nr:N-acetyltransferase [Phenylobacterium immobile]